MKKKEYGEAALQLHRRIIKAVEKASEGSDASCALVSAIEKEVGKDPRTVRYHLSLLQEAGYGKFSNEGKIFCPSHPTHTEKKQSH